MPIDPRLLEILICPACHGEIVALDADRGLECRACGRVYPIRDGIPVMLIDEASAPTREPGPTPRDTQQTATMQDGQTQDG